MSAESDIVEEPAPADRRGHKPSERRCVASGAVRDPSAMVRYVLSPDGDVVADVYGKLPGRGAWVTAAEEPVRTAVQKGGFNRGFKAKVRADADALVAQTRTQLRRRLLGQLTMARKAGRLVFGEAGVREPAARGDVALRIEASDGAADGRGKLRTLSLATARELSEQGLRRPDPPVVGCFTAEEIGAALGRDPVVHAALLAGPMVADIMAGARRLAGFEPLVPPDWSDARHEIRLEPPPGES
ncbi:RNA-binding protein [uncultured Algimonas sp.]|uniref:RNA-binding protein n=1 Tax=uncultured Algimonas sp. TaxID=1547920 RepID=UPI002607F241|nr:RNA-binding protein [uncultured Algimonas sp.]